MQDTDKSQALLREITRTKNNKKTLLESKAMLKMKEQQVDDQQAVMVEMSTKIDGLEKELSSTKEKLSEAQ